MQTKTIQLYKMYNNSLKHLATLKSSAERSISSPVNWLLGLELAFPFFLGLGRSALLVTLEATSLSGFWR